MCLVCSVCVQNQKSHLHTHHSFSTMGITFTTQLFSTASLGYYGGGQVCSKVPSAELLESLVKRTFFAFLFTCVTQGEGVKSEPCKWNSIVKLVPFFTQSRVHWGMINKWVKEEAERREWEETSSSLHFIPPSLVQLHFIATGNRTYDRPDRRRGQSLRCAMCHHQKITKDEWQKWAKLPRTQSECDMKWVTHVHYSLCVCLCFFHWLTLSFSLFFFLSSSFSLSLSLSLSSVARWVLPFSFSLPWIGTTVTLLE